MGERGGIVFCSVGTFWVVCLWSFIIGVTLCEFGLGGDGFCGFVGGLVSEL